MRVSPLVARNDAFTLQLEDEVKHLAERECLDKDGDSVPEHRTGHQVERLLVSPLSSQTALPLAPAPHQASRELTKGPEPQEQDEPPDTFGSGQKRLDLLPQVEQPLTG